MAFIIFGCRSNDLNRDANSLPGSKHLNINYSPNSDRFDLEVSNSLNKSGLFTLSLLDTSDEEPGKTVVYLLFKDQSGKIYTNHLYTIELGHQQKFEESKSYLIDDNPVEKNSNGKYVIYNQGKADGFSEESVVQFIPSDIKKGRYEFQVVLYIENSDIYVYSNIIELDIPLDLYK